eukprot:313703_1
MSQVARDKKRLTKEGQLIIHTDSNKKQPQWVVLKNNNLYFYETENNQNKYTHKLHLKSFTSIASKKKTSKQFYLKSKTGHIQQFDALSIDEKNEWIEAINSNLYAETYGPTIKTHEKVETICSIWLVILCIVIVILFIISTMSTDSYIHNAISSHMFCIPLSQYQLALIILCAYYAFQFSWNDTTQIMSIDKFWTQSLLCFCYNIIAFFLLTINLIIKLVAKDTDIENSFFFANVAVFLFGAFSISFPEVCIRLHQQFKYNEKKEPSISAKKSQLSDSLCDFENNIVQSWLTNTVHLPQHYEVFEESKIDDMSIVKNLTEKDLKEMEIKIGDRKIIMKYINKIKHRISRSFNIVSPKTVSISASRPIFRDNITKGVMCMCYLVHFLVYVLDPILAKSIYYEMIGIMNLDFDKYNVILCINEIFLRNFVGISLISVFFTFVTELTDKQIIISDYFVVWLMWKERKNRFWYCLLLFMVFMLPLEIFPMRRLLSSGVYFYHGFWIVGNICAAVIAIHFIILFSGAYHKTKDKYQRFHNFRAKSPKSPIITFVLESMLLFASYSIYCLFLCFYMFNDDESISMLLDATRQTVILILTVFQFFTLIRVKQLQKFPNGMYLERFSKRLPWILHGYYKLNCLMILYNIIYCFMFQIQYFGSIFDKQKKHIYEKIAFGFSFSLPASMLFILSHFVDSYNQWTNDERTVEYLSVDILSSKKNNKLDKFMSEQSSRTHVQSFDDGPTSSLLTANGSNNEIE